MLNIFWVFHLTKQLLPAVDITIVFLFLNGYPGHIYVPYVGCLELANKSTEFSIKFNFR